MNRFFSIALLMLFLCTSLNAQDLANKDFASILKEYEKGDKDSALLHDLALLAAAKKDSASLSGRLFANEYVKQLKNPFDSANLKFIDRFLCSVTDEGFPIFYNNIKKVNDILGKDAAEAKITEAIDFAYVMPAINKGNPNWKLLKQKVAKYGSLGDELIKQTQVLYATNHNDWNLFATIAHEWFTTYGSKRKWIGDELLNGIAWATFVNTDDKKALKTALLMSEKSISTDSVAHRIDTYANLLYKLGKKENAIVWEQKAMQLNPDEVLFKEALERMKKNEPTWPD